MGGEGVHIVETRMFCTVCLYSSCLLICFPFLKFGSITNSHTNNPNSERGKNWSKTMEKQKKSPPRHLSSFSSDPLVSWVDFFSFVFSRFLPPWPKNAPKPMEKQKKTSFTPCHLSSFSSNPLHGSIFFFCFLEVFATLAQKCPKTHGKTKKRFHPMSPVQLLLRPFHGSKLLFFCFFCVLEVFATLAQKCHKTHGKNKKTK